MSVVKQDALHRAIDHLSADQLVKVADFITLLQSTQVQGEALETDSQLRYSQSSRLHQLREQLTQKYNESVNEDNPALVEEEFAWLEQIPEELQAEFLLDLLLAAHQAQQSHNWSEVIRVIKYWKAIAKNEPPFEPVNFPEGLLKGYDFSPEFIAQARKEMWGGFGEGIE